jgi:hypothetical protein
MIGKREKMAKPEPSAPLFERRAFGEGRKRTRWGGLVDERDGSLGMNVIMHRETIGAR